MGGSGSVPCLKLFALEPGPKPFREERKSEGGGGGTRTLLHLCSQRRSVNDDAHAHADDNSAKGASEFAEDDGVG